MYCKHHKLFSFIILLFNVLYLSSSEQPLFWQAPIQPHAMYGDPERGSEPDPSKASPTPPYEINWPINVGNPVSDWGHFRLKKSALAPSMFLPFSVAEQQQAMKAFTTHDWQDGSLLRVSTLRPAASKQKPKNGWPLIVFCPGSGDVGRGKFQTNKITPDPALYWATAHYRQHLPAIILRMHPMQRTLVYTEDKPYGDIEIKPALHAYLNAIEAMIATGEVDPKRVSLYGFSMGGSSVWQLARIRPELFAAAAPCAGSPLSFATQEEFKKLNTIQFWTFMGNMDPWSGSSKYNWAYGQMRKAGHQHLRFWETQDIAHDEKQICHGPLAQWLWNARKIKP